MRVWDTVYNARDRLVRCSVRSVFNSECVFLLLLLCANGATTYGRSEYDIRERRPPGRNKKRGKRTTRAFCTTISKTTVDAIRAAMISFCNFTLFSLSAARFCPKKRETRHEKPAGRAFCAPNRFAAGVRFPPGCIVLFYASECIRPCKFVEKVLSIDKSYLTSGGFQMGGEGGGDRPPGPVFFFFLTVKYGHYSRSIE